MSNEYKIQKKLLYGNKEGVETEASFITYSEFSAKQMADTVPIKQICMRAFTGMAQKSGINPEDVDDDKKDNKDESALTGIELMQAILSSEEDCLKLFIHMKQLLTGGLCQVDGETKFTRPIWDDLSMEDMEGLCGAYVLDFIMSSVLKD